MMKWLCIECRPWLFTGSCNVTFANGTLPIAASKTPSGRRVSAKLSVRIVAFGYSPAAIPAVTGSSSTPVIWAFFGAMPMKVPAPEPGSSTRPPSKPNSRIASHIASTMAASV